MKNNETEKLTEIHIIRRDIAKQALEYEHNEVKMEPPKQPDRLPSGEQFPASAPR